MLLGEYLVVNGSSNNVDAPRPPKPQPNPLPTWDFPKFRVPYFGGAHNKDPTI